MAPGCFELDGAHRSAFLRYLAHYHREEEAAALPCGERFGPEAVFVLVPGDAENAPFSRGLGLGRRLVRHDGHVFEVELREEGRPCGDLPAYFTRLRVSGSNCEALHAFLEQAVKFRPTPPPGRLWTFAASRYGQWRETGTLPAQSFDDLFLPEDDVKGLLAHVDGFLESSDRFARAGRVQKLCLLFVGLPGSGKSSLVRALALKYRRDLYSLGLAGVSDSVCNELVSGLGQDGLLLVEDFDSLGFSLSAGRKRTRDEDRVGVSRSCFLNLLDGNAAPPKGTIVCLTANTSTGFDQALVRAGRVDRIVTFREPQPPEVLSALRRLADEGEGREESFAAFCAKVKKIRAGVLCMAAVVDHIFRHPSDYLETFEELEQHCSDRSSLMRDDDKETNRDGMYT